MNNFPDESLIAVAVNRKQKDLIEQKLLIKLLMIMVIKIT